MNTIVLYDESVDIPGGIDDLRTFRRCGAFRRLSDDGTHLFPERPGVGRDEYLAVRKQVGWMKSRVLGRSFRLSRHVDDAGNPEYSLAAR